MRSLQKPALIEDFLEASGAKCLNSAEFSDFMDRNDSLQKFRNEFAFPKVKNISQLQLESQDGDRDCIYFTGNSLGLQSRKSKEMIEAAMKSWAEIAVEGWFQSSSGNLCWSEMENLEQPGTKMENVLAKVVGAKPIEVAVAATLTQNLNNLLLTFYDPTNTRHKILMEGNAFPSDRYAIEAQIQLRGSTAAESLILQYPREGEHCLRTEDILDTIEKHGEEIALVIFSGIQYYTGQLFQIKEITEAGHSKGCVVGWDLAHAAGNVPLSLHDWNVDFAVWCSYKYLNSGPGGIGCLFVHEKHAMKKFEGQRLAGWWALDCEQRFKMEDVFVPRAGAAGFAQSTVDILSLSSLLGSLQVFSQTNIDELRKKSLLLTSYLEYLLQTEISESSLSIITPSDPDHRGCQLSLIVHTRPLETVHQHLLNHGVVCDKRYPNCIRVAPVPLYSTFDDVRRFVEILKLA